MASRLGLTLARHASTASGSGKHKVVVVGGGKLTSCSYSLLFAHISPSGSGGLAAANQIYNLLKSQGQAPASGDIAIIDVSPSSPEATSTDIAKVQSIPRLSTRVDSRGLWSGGEVLFSEITVFLDS